jgi:hypothetical protein
MSYFIVHERREAHNHGGGAEVLFLESSVKRAKCVTLVTALALLLNWRTGDRSVGTEHTTIARLWLQQNLTARAFVKILTGIHGHGLLLRVAAVRASQNRFQDNRAHGLAMTFEGKPASVVA